MRAFLIASLGFFVAGCGSPRPEQIKPLPPAEEAPFFRIDPTRTGPLTLDELQIDLPDNIEGRLNQDQIRCFLNNVENLASDAGDPETLDPDGVEYLHPKEQWPLVTAKARRAILAQAILSNSMAPCLES